MLSLKNFSQPFTKLIMVYTFWIVSSILAGSLFEVYFFNLGLSIREIFATGFFWFLGSLLLAPLFKKIEMKKFILLGILIGLISVVILYFFRLGEAAFFYRFLLSLTQFFFWIPFNTLFYEFRKNNNAFLGAVYYSVGSFFNLILPAFAGVIAASLGYSTLYILAIGTYAICFILALTFLENKSYNYNLVESIKSIDGLKTLIFFEGFSGSIIASVTLETMLLNYTNTPFGFGAFLSLATLFSIIATFLTAKFSDHKKRRREYLIASAIVFGIGAAFTSMAKSIETFFIGVAFMNFFRTIFFPLGFALVVDNTKKLTDTIIGREYILNFGRVFGIVTGFAIMFYYDISMVLLINGLSLAAYGLVFEFKKRKLKKI